jgi:hypothetical protein
MKNIFLFVTFLSVFSIHAAETMHAPEITSEAESQFSSPDFNPRANHWLASFAFETMRYELPFERFRGEKEKIAPTKRSLWGGRIGFGREFHLGRGIMTATRLEGYYMGTLFEKARTADPEVSVEIGSVKDVGQILGGDISQSLSYLFDFKAKNPFMEEMTYLFMEPYVEAGIGRARALNQKKYFYDSAGEVTEAFDQTFVDDLTNFRIGVGVRITSLYGYFLDLKTTMNKYDISERRSRGYVHPDGGSRDSLDRNISNADMDPVMVYSIGGGYKF